ncbi:hypothetical protein ACHAWF_011337 [Thalassiosira exigua]
MAEATAPRRFRRLFRRLPRPLLSAACLAALFARPAAGLGVSLRPSAARWTATELAPTSVGPSASVDGVPRLRRRRRRATELALSSDAEEPDENQRGEGGPADDGEEVGSRRNPPSAQPTPRSGGEAVRARRDGDSLARAMALLGTSPRRIFLSASSAASIALVGNLFGITSDLLSALPEDAVEKTGLDAYYPRGDFKRVVVRGGGGGGDPGISAATTAGGGGGGGKCTFLVPKEWVADTGLALAQARRRARTLDYSMSSGGPGGRASSSSEAALPDAAYGPPGRLDDRGLSNGDTNVSVIVNAGVRDFRLASSLGADPGEAAEALLSKRRSPTALLAAREERRGPAGLPVYQFEYTVDRGEGRSSLRAISVVAGSEAGDAFVTLTVVSPEAEWDRPDVDARLRRVAESFKIV